MRRAMVDHFAVAARCRANLGEWQDVGEYNSTQSAYGMLGVIRTGYAKRPSQQSPYTPTGAFEARQTLTEFGSMVQARYVGVSDDVAWADALAALAGDTA